MCLTYIYSNKYKCKYLIVFTGGECLENCLPGTSVISLTHRDLRISHFISNIT